MGVGVGVGGGGAAPPPPPPLQDPPLRAVGALLALLGRALSGDVRNGLALLGPYGSYRYRGGGGGRIGVGGRGGCTALGFCGVCGNPRDAIGVVKS